MRFPDPNNTLIFNRTKEELECFLLFCVVVAGKKASIQVKLLHSLLNGTQTPFSYLKELDNNGLLAAKLKESKIGQYTRLSSCFRQLINSGLDLYSCTVDDLENIFGIGPKTARFFITCTRKDVRHCVIDTHQLKYMSQHLGWDVPTNTPSNKKEYLQIESRWLSYVDSMNLNSAALDLAIWKMYANRDDSEYRVLTGV
jgi:thermostable 8-oxoguanine DNA glycosylase